MLILLCVIFVLLLSAATPELWAAPMTFPAAAPISAGDIAYREQPVYYSGTEFKREFNAESVGIYGLSHNIAFIFEENPIQYNQQSFTDPVFHTPHSWGPGDLSILPRYTFWEQDGIGTTNRLSALGGLLVPLGPHNQADSYGRLPYALQPSTGAWGTKDGLIFTRQTLSTEIDGYGGFVHHTASHGYQLGNSYFADDSLQYRVAPKLKETGVPSVETFLVFETNFLVNENDQQLATPTLAAGQKVPRTTNDFSMLPAAPVAQTTIADPLQSGSTLDLVGMTPNMNSGGKLVQFDPGIRFVGKNWGFAALAEVPGYQHVNGSAPERNYGILLVYRHVWFTRHHL